MTRCGLIAALTVATLAGAAEAGDEHWSRQFPKPKSSTKMAPNTGMSDGTNKPIFRRAKWHDGKLWFCGAWECGASGENPSKSQRNVYWNIWTWSPEGGWEPFAYFHSSQGGIGPDGKINDFLWLPDGRMVIAGEFTRLDNPGGIMYHDVDAVAVYDPKEPTANKWKPLGTFQYDGTVSPGGSTKCLAYDAKNNDLYIGGAFGGIQGPRADRKWSVSPSIHKYDFDTKSYEPISPGAPRGAVNKIVVSHATTPPTIYVGGKFNWTGGNGEDPMESKSTSRYSPSFSHYQEGKGWTWYPTRGVKPQDGGKNSILQRAADFKYFDSKQVLDMLIDGKDIWIVGAFSEGKGTGQKLRGIAKWDAEKQIWTDPTGKGGVGRECYSIAKADNGKIYFAGSFGGRTGKKFYDGFKNGDKAHLAMSFDPKTGKWEQLGSGLGSRSMPECRLTVNGNDVYYFGDFNYIGGEREGKNRREDKAFESWYVARWNETIDFTKNPPKLPAQATKRSIFWTPPSASWSTGNEHWSRAYPKPPRARGKKHQMSGATGMDNGTGAPQISGVAKIGDTTYVCGRWEAIRNINWHVWSHHPKKGWNPVAWKESSGATTGVGSPPGGMEVHDGKLWVYGAISSHKGIGIYDPETNKWSKLESKTHDGKPVIGISADPKRSGPVNDVAWDEKTGDIFLIGTTTAHTNPAYKSPLAVGPVLKINKEGLATPLGRTILAENLGKPVLNFDCIYLDKTKSPPDLYIGGTFNYYGESSNNSRMCYNVAKYDYEKKDWVPVGEGVTLFGTEITMQYYPKGLPGLPAKPELYHGFEFSGFPRVRCMTMDKDGNIYVGGSLGVVSGKFPIHERMKEESFGIAKLNRKTNRWETCTKAGGVSSDIHQMSWIDDTHLLLSGSFHFDNQWSPLHAVAVLDITTGDLKPLGGGLLRITRSQVIGSVVSHFIEGDDWYFAGLFEYAGINVNDMTEAPNESYYIAHWNGKKNFDPNRGLEVAPVKALKKPSGFSSKSFQVKIEAKLSGDPGTLTWYERRSDGKFTKKGSGLSFTAKLRLKGDSDDQYVYVTVTRGGVEGGKTPVRIPVE